MEPPLAVKFCELPEVMVADEGLTEILGELTVYVVVLDLIEATTTLLLFVSFTIQ